MTTRHRFARHNVLLLALILAGFGLRLTGLGRQSLWYDETVSAFLASLPPAELVAHTARDIHPPGYYLLLHYWTILAGHRELALVYFSAFFGMLLIPLTYRLAKTLLNRHVAAWVAFLVTISPYHLWYTQEVRMYTLAAACGLLAAIWGIWALRGQPRYWVGYAAAASIGLYALYYFSFLLIALNLCFLWMVLRPTLKRQALKFLVAANLLGVVVYLPWLPVAWKQATNPPVPPWRTAPTLSLAAIESWTALSLGQSVEPDKVWAVLLLTLILCGLGLMSMRRSVAGFAAMYTFGPLLLILALSAVTPLYHVRYLFTYSVGFYILLAAGLHWLATRIRFWVGLGVAAILLAASIYSIVQYYVDPRYQADDYRAAVHFIDEHWQPGDALLANAGYTYTAFIYYTNLPHLQRQRLVPYPDPPNDSQPLLLETGTIDGPAQLGWGDPQSDFYSMSTATTIAALEQLARDYPRLWMLRAYDTVTDPTGLIRAWLAKNTIPLEDQQFSGPSNIRAQGFLLKPKPPPPQVIQFKDGMVLYAWQLPATNWRPGDTIPVKLWWMSTAVPSADYKMSLKLWTAAGQLAAQGRDEWPGGALYRARSWPVGQVVYQPGQISLSPDLPPGQYWLNVELYHPQTIQPLPLRDDSTTAVTLGAIQVK